MKNIYSWTIIIILFLSAFLRLGFPDLAEYGMDEDNTTCNILHLIENDKPPPFIVRPHGVFTISTVYTLLYFIMLFIRDPRLIILITIGIPNTVAVVLCFLFCYRFIDKRTAILATALFGVSSWAVLCSKKLWGADILQFFSILIFYILLLGITKSKFKLILLPILILPFLPSLHLTSLCIFVSVFLILVIYYKRNLKYLFIAGAILLIPVIIFFIYSGGLHGKFGLRVNILAPYFHMGPILPTINLLVRGGWYYSYLWIFPKYRILENFTDIFIKIIFIFGCVHTIKRMAQDLKNNSITAYVVSGIWYFTFIILFGFTNLTYHAHYFIVVLPVLFIITAIGFFSIIDIITGKNKIQDWELLLLSFIFLLWSPGITILAILVLLCVNKMHPKNIMYGTIIFILVFQVFTNIKLFIDIDKAGGVPGRAGLDLGSKIRTVEYVVKDAERRFDETKEKSYYSIVNDDYYEYLFKYLIPKNKDYISVNKINNGFHYIINGDIACKGLKKIGNKFITVEKINET